VIVATDASVIIQCQNNSTRGVVLLYLGLIKGLNIMLSGNVFQTGQGSFFQAKTVFESAPLIGVTGNPPRTIVLKFAC
jgi:hypothetical protein